MTDYQSPIIYDNMKISIKQQYNAYKFIRKEGILEFSKIIIF